MTNKTIIGIDVSKRWLEVRIHGLADSLQIGNDPDGYRTLLEHTDSNRPQWIVFEATGGYESRAVKALSEAGYAVAVDNPTRVRRFADTMGVLVKIDKINAQMVAHFASVVL